MRTLYFCGGCALLFSDDELQQDFCSNCNTPVSEQIPGQFTDEDASKLETAYTDQTQ